MNVLNQISQLKGQLEYVNNILGKGGLEKWEAKEYSILSTQYSDEIIRLEKYVQDNIEVFA